MSGRRFINDFPLLESLLLLTICSLLFQLFPSLQERVLAAADVRYWSRSAWFVANLGVILFLLWIRFGPAVWYTLIIVTKRLGTASREATNKGETPPAIGITEYYLKPRRDVRELLREDEARQFMSRRRIVFRGALAVLLVGCLILVAWAKMFGDANPSDFEMLYRNHPGQLHGASGIVGGVFKVRDDRDVTITHIGIFDSGDDGIHLPHRLGLFEVDGSDLKKVSRLVNGRVPIGKALMLRDGYRWKELSEPLTLKAGREYILCAEMFSGGKDLWPDCFLTDGKSPAIPKWNSYFVNGQLDFTREPLSKDKLPWPQPPTKEVAPDSGSVYGVVNLAEIRVVGGH